MVKYVNHGEGLRRVGLRQTLTATLSVPQFFSPCDCLSPCYNSSHYYKVNANYRQMALLIKIDLCFRMDMLMPTTENSYAKEASVIKKKNIHHFQHKSNKHNRYSSISMNSRQPLILLSEFVKNKNEKTKQNTDKTKQ